MHATSLRDAAAVASDLARLVEGEVRFDAIHRTLYSTAACIYQILPLGAVVPRHEADVLAVVDYARRHHIPITARGAGSGVAGQTLGRGIIIDFSKYFRRITDVDRERGTVRVQPGVILAQLNRVLRRHGMQFGPDPSSSAFCTLGGMIANNAGGSHTVRYGATRQNTLALRMALANVSVIETRPVDRPGRADRSRSEEDPVVRLSEGLRRIVEAHRPLIETWTPGTRRNSSGYALLDSVNGQVDLARLFAGSEGTLGLVLDATLRIVPLPRAKATALVLFDDLQKSGAAVVEVLRARPSAVELLDRTILDVVREASPSACHTGPRRFSSSSSMVMSRLRWTPA
jgi:FAD/FMN-containing dehydrogenase